MEQQVIINRKELKELETKAKLADEGYQKIFEEGVLVHCFGSQQIFLKTLSEEELKKSLIEINKNQEKHIKYLEDMFSSYEKSYSNRINAFNSLPWYKRIFRKA